MKKSLLTLLGAGLLLTSCQSDEPFAPVEGGEKQVTFTLNVPGELGTRAGVADNASDKGGFSNGQGTLYYTLVLDANGDTRVFKDATVSNNGRTATFTPTVVLGRDYTITAYASFDDNTSINAKADIEAIEVSKNFNDESKDAYFQTTTHNFAEGDLQPLTLTRPFGKLRLVATDYQATGNGNTAIKSVKVKYNNNVFTTFNAVSGEFSNGQSYEHTLDGSNYSTSYYAPEKDENGNVTGQTIFADYVPVNSTGVAPFTITVEYNSGETYTRSFSEDIPVKRNGLTTLRGNFFTANAEIKVNVEEDFENTTVIEEIVKITNAGELQDAINKAKDNTVIYLANDITGDVVATQKPNVKVTIFGQGNKFNGVLTVDGKSSTYTTAGLTIKNVVFNAQTISADACINLGKSGDNNTRYTCNVTVDNCTFDVPGAVGVKSYTGGDKNLTITGCTATANAHSLVQLAGVENVLIDGCTINSVRGMNFNSSTDVKVNNCSIDVQKYAARYGAGDNADTVAEIYSIKNSTLKSANVDGDAVIVLRGNAAESTLTIDNTTIEGVKQIENNATNATIIIDGVPTVYSAKGLFNVVAKGYTNINLADGEYDVYGCGGKTLTLNGSENAIIKLYNDGEDGCDYAFGGNGTGVGNVTFNGLTINTTSNTGNYKGFAYMKGTFNDCKFEGAYSLNNANDFVFEGCTFDFKNGYFWTWAANTVTFDGCTFNGNSKNILAHGTASTVININNCTFAATEKGFTGAGDNTAVVEIDPAGSNTYTINFTGTNTKTEFYNGWTRVKDSSTGHIITGVQ